MQGRSQVVLALMPQACEDDTGNTDLLNQGSFTAPEFSKSYAAQKAYEVQWKQFRADIDQQLKPLQRAMEESNKVLHGTS